ncbi:DUF2802 domain-containing protein [Ectothiorhodospira variabilis]|uniref:DUF2802 domain-containing protein n=1 Tax=Ectothiorhodospira variabilis TaxID=505694 RepID=UPI001EFA80F7|nr:DUF2802 domain-containing protein [Ectothiorhodospira variabilis]MCG5494037.1 DUF2802 domain-containing protein [Ectothiorhodospira variabilis]MCG5503433.1 DUF2802 domain-containing protein [Ectothiorhodospira variabilis]MCG5506479.1 DUF2802 domain-containing protein [Ectothiorhodospira variabilis]
MTLTIAIGGALLLLFALALSAASMWVCARQSRSMKEMEFRLQSQERALGALRGALSALHVEDQHAEEYRARIERQIARLAEQQEELLLRVPDEGAYQHALRLVRQGAGREALVDQCGLSLGEAELLLAMHRDQSPS